MGIPSITPVATSKNNPSGKKTIPGKEDLVSSDRGNETVTLSAHKTLFPLGIRKPEILVRMRSTNE